MAFKLSTTTFGYTYDYKIGENTVKTGKDYKLPAEIYHSEDEIYVRLTVLDESAKRELTTLAARDILKGAEMAVKRACKLPEGVFEDANGQPVTSIDAFIKMADTEIILDIFAEIMEPCGVNPN